MSSLKQSSPFSNLVVKETATLNWTSNRFAQFREVQSPYFSPHKSAHQFRLELNTTDHIFNGRRVLLELRYNQHEVRVPLRYRISILDANGEKHFTKEYLWNYQKDDYGLCRYNVTNYIPIYKCNDFLENGSLKIYCEVDILNEKYDQLPPQQIEFFCQLSQNYETLFEDGKLSDFIVLVGDKQLCVHKAVLAAQSPVFAAMFEHDETQEVKDGRVLIEDIEVDVFELLIRYIYTGKVNDLGENAAKLFAAADKYQLNHLKSICEQSLISSLTVESVSCVLLLSDMHSAGLLKAKCTAYKRCVEHRRMEAAGSKCASRFCCGTVCKVCHQRRLIDK